MKTKNALIIGTLMASSLFGAVAFADSTASGSTSTGEVVTTSTGTLETGTGLTSTGTTETNTGVTSTGTTSTGVIAQDKDKINENRAKIDANWSKFHEDYGFIKQFLIAPKTKAEAKTIAASLKVELKAYHEAIKSLIKEGQASIKANTFDPVVFNVKATEIFAKHIESLSKYVDPAKMDAFKKFMDEKKSLITANKDLRKENFQLRKEIQEIKKRIFSEKQRQALADKLAKKEKSVLERLLNVIDTYSSKTKNERLKSQLAELKEITQERIDALK